jgi:hypothetical protein
VNNFAPMEAFRAYNSPYTLTDQKQYVEVYSDNVGWEVIRNN